jgi:hypothetical protein
MVASRREANHKYSTVTASFFASGHVIATNEGNVCDEPPALAGIPVA